MQREPTDRPHIPTDGNHGEPYAVFAIYHPAAARINSDSLYHVLPFAPPKSRSPTGCYIYVNNRSGRSEYYHCTAGSFMRNAQIQRTDVLLPGAREGHRGIGRIQFRLGIDRSTKTWVLQTKSMYSSTVNDVPLLPENGEMRTRRDRPPHTLHLDPHHANTIEIDNLTIKIWMVKPAEHCVPPTEALPLVDEEEDSFIYDLPIHFEPPADPQDVSKREEPWRKLRYLLEDRKLLSRARQVLNPFTGSIEVVTVFEKSDAGRKARDKEFYILSLELASNEKYPRTIIKYLDKLDVRGTPTILTERYTGFHTFRDFLPAFKDIHPGMRCRMGQMLLRELMSALEFLHAHGIFHGGISLDSVLVRGLTEEKAEILITDFGNSERLEKGVVKTPRPLFLQDVERAVVLVDLCSNLSEYRRGAKPDALSPLAMAKTREAVWSFQKQALSELTKFHLLPATERDTRVQRVLERNLSKANATAFPSHTEEEAKRLDLTTDLEALDQTEFEEIVAQWRRKRPNSDAPWYMTLTLGHRFLDQLIRQVAENHLLKTAQEICQTLRRIEGNCPDPWRTIPITKRLDFPLQRTALDCNATWVKMEPVGKYLLHCSERWPAYATAIEDATNRLLKTKAGARYRPCSEFFECMEAFKQKNHMPRQMAKELAFLKELMEKTSSSQNWTVSLNVTFDLWYHLPSYTFNVSQMSDMAEPERLDALTELEFLKKVLPELIVDKFWEVRGERVLEGHYVSVNHLHSLAEHFFLKFKSGSVQLPARSERAAASMTYFDPEQVVILAHRGLVGFGTVGRADHKVTQMEPPRENDMPLDKYLSTCFGNIPVELKRVNQLDPLGRGNDRSIARANHWSGFWKSEQRRQRKVRFADETETPLKKHTTQNFISQSPAYRVEGWLQDLRDSRGVERESTKYRMKRRLNPDEVQDLEDVKRAKITPVTPRGRHWRELPEHQQFLDASETEEATQIRTAVTQASLRFGTALRHASTVSDPDLHRHWDRKNDAQVAENEGDAEEGIDDSDDSDATVVDEDLYKNYIAEKARAKHDSQTEGEAQEEDVGPENRGDGKGR